MKKQGVFMRKRIMMFIIICFILFFNLSPTKGFDDVKIPVLMYHHLDDNLNNNVAISPNNFESQMKALKEEGYNTITIQQLNDYLDSGIKLPPNPLLITFDDGYLSNYEKAYPILKKYEMHAEIFVIASQILEKGEVPPHSKAIPKMNWDQLKEMNDYITIQSHSWDSHYKLKSRNGKVNAALFGPAYINGELENQQQYEKRIKHDFIRSRNLIKEKLGYEPVAISYPYGNISADAINIAKDAGFTLGFVINNKGNLNGDYRFSLNRITVNGNDSGVELINKIKNSSF